MKYTTYLWDFNGTIIDDVGIGISSINELLSKRNMPLISSLNEYYSHFRFPIIEYYKSLYFDFEAESFNELSVEWVKTYRRLVKRAPLRAGIIEALEQIRSSGYEQFILSATQREMLEDQLSGLGISQYFSKLLARDDIYASGKADIALSWYNKDIYQNAVLIGDTAEDFKVADILGIDVLLIAGGHQSKAMLLELTDKVFDSVSDAMEYIKV